MSRRVFLCHAGKDKARFAEPLGRRLRERGFDPWLDVWDILPGDSLTRRVFEDGLARADAVVVVLSRNSLRNPWVMAELDLAAKRMIEDGIRVIAVRLDDSPVPSSLEGRAWVAVDPDKDWSPQLDRIARALAEDADAATPRSASPSARLRRKLEDPSGWLEADAEIASATDAAVSRLRDARPPTDGDLPTRLHRLLGCYDEITAPLAEVLAQCGFVGDPDQPRLWIRPLQRVLRTGQPAHGRDAGEMWERAAWYPALRLAYAIGVAAVAGGREGLLHPLLGQQVPVAREVRPLWRALLPDRVVDPGLAQLLPGWTGRCRALSIHLRGTLRPALAGILPEDEYAEAFERYEYLRSLLELHASDGRTTALGEFAWYLNSGRTLIEDRITEEVAALGTSWPLLRAGAFGGQVAAVGVAQARLREHLRRRFF